MSKKSLKLAIALLVLAAIFKIPVAYAGEPRLMATYGDWEAYVFTENGHKVCYMSSQPKKKQGNYTKRGEPFALITHRPANNTRDVFSYITGYTYKSESKATVNIEKEVERVSDELNIPISLIAGENVAKFVLKYGKDMLFDI